MTLHPLRPATIAVLRRLALVGPLRARLIPSSIRRRLEREGLAEGTSEFIWNITAAGRERLREIDGKDPK